MIPADSIIMRAFNRGKVRGSLLAKYGRTQCPYGDKRPYQRDAWFAGYDYAAGRAAR